LFTASGVSAAERAKTCGWRLIILVVMRQWDEIKQAEKRERAERRSRRGITEDFKSGFLGSVQRSFPALTEALKLQERAA
ncbi:hypothetical protein AB9F36_34000, partial [Rhizobium leguminosarum]